MIRLSDHIAAAGGNEADGAPTVADPWNNRMVLVRG